MWHGFIEYDENQIHRVTLTPRITPRNVKKVLEAHPHDYATEYRQIAVDLQVIGLKLYDLYTRLLETSNERLRQQDQTKKSNPEEGDPQP